MFGEPAAIDVHFFVDFTQIIWLIVHEICMSPEDLILRVS